MSDGSKNREGGWGGREEGSGVVNAAVSSIEVGVRGQKPKRSNSHTERLLSARREECAGEN